jgi:hypothetical protein
MLFLFIRSPCTCSRLRVCFKPWRRVVVSVRCVPCVWDIGENRWIVPLAATPIPASPWDLALSVSIYTGEQSDCAAVDTTVESFNVFTHCFGEVFEVIHHVATTACGEALLDDRTILVSSDADLYLLVYMKWRLMACLQRSTTARITILASSDADLYLLVYMKWRLMACLQRSTTARII